MAAACMQSGSCRGRDACKGAVCRTVPPAVHCPHQCHCVIACGVLEPTVCCWHQCQLPTCLPLRSKVIEAAEIDEINILQVRWPHMLEPCNQWLCCAFQLALRIHKEKLKENAKVDQTAAGCMPFASPSDSATFSSMRRQQ